MYGGGYTDTSYGIGDSIYNYNDSEVVTAGESLAALAANMLVH